MHSLLIGLSLIRSHLKSPELNELEDWYRHHLLFLSRSKVRTKPHVGHVVVAQLLLGLSGHCRKVFAQRSTLENPAELMLVLRSCILLCGFAGLLISRKLWVEGMWDGYELFPEGLRWLISPVQVAYMRKIQMLCRLCRYFPLLSDCCLREAKLLVENMLAGRENLSKRVFFLWHHRRYTSTQLSLMIEPTETVSSGCIRKMQAA